MKKLNILQITPFYPPGFAFGGPTHVSGSFARSMQLIGHQVTTITSNRNGDDYSDVPEDILEEAGNKTIYCETKRGRFLFSHNLIGVIKKYIKSADVVFINSQWNYFFRVGCKLAYKYNLPYILRPAGIFNPWAISYKKWRKKIWWELFDKKNYERASAIIALTADEATQIRNMGIYNRVEIIPNGVNLDDFEESLTREEIELRFPQLKGRRWLLFMGRLHPIKGVDLLIAAFAELRRRFPDVMLVLAGPNEGNYRSVIDQQLKELGIDEDICFTGMVSGALKNGLLKHSEIFCLTSYSEGLPVSVLEAMACGLPVVVTEECHIPEIKEYNAGIVVEKDHKKIASRISLILSDYNGFNRMKKNAKRLIEEKFERDYIYQKYSNLFQGLV